MDQWSEEVQLDMAYGLLSFEVRSSISRNEFNTFNDLITKARHIEHFYLEKLSNVSKNKNNSQNSS